MNKKRDVAFIILTWNSEAYIEKCLDSIIECKDINPTIFVADNNSKDGTRKMLARYRKSNKQVNLIFETKNLGTTISRNHLLKSLNKTYDFLCILDSDTVINNQAINDMIKCLEQDVEIGIVGPTMCNSAGDSQMNGRNFPTIKIKLLKALPLKRMQLKGQLLETPKFTIEQKAQNVDYLLSACWLLPWGAFKKIGYFDERIFYAPEDVDYCARAWLAGYKVVLLQTTSIIHEYQRISKKKLLSKANLEHVKGLIYYFYKYRNTSLQAIRQSKETR